MTEPRSGLKFLPCLDSTEMSESRKRELGISRQEAAALGRSALEAVGKGHYLNEAGEIVELSSYVRAACSARVSIAPEDPLPTPGPIPFPGTRIQVANETTLQASLRFVQDGLKPLALNIPPSFSVRGAVAPSPMIRIVLPSIFEMRWRPSLAERSPTSSLPLRIGRRRGSFSVHFAMFSAPALGKARIGSGGEAPRLFGR